MDWAKEQLAWFIEGAHKDIHSNITCYKTCIYQYDSESKFQSAEWVFLGDYPPFKVECGQSEGVLILWHASSFLSHWRIST